MTIQPIGNGMFEAKGFYDGMWHEAIGYSLLEALERLFISIHFAE